MEGKVFCRRKAVLCILYILFEKVGSDQVKLCGHPSMIPELYLLSQ